MPVAYLRVGTYAWLAPALPSCRIEVSEEEEDSMIVVTGATGKLGSLVVEGLLATEPAALA
jgi:FlaA1/EpsC-like NDP-sugar epimerase